MSKSTPTVPTWKTEFNSRIEAFSTAIGVDEVKVREILTDLGVDGESDQSLSLIDSEDYLPMGDLRKEFVDSGLTKIAKLRFGMPHLRGATRLDSAAPTTNGGLSSLAGSIEKMVASNRPKADWKDEELLKVYDRDSTEVAEILGKRAHGRPFVVFSKSGDINVEASLKLIKIAKRQPTSDRFIIDNKPVRVYRAGEFLAILLDESPFFRGVALVEGYCSKSDTSWDGVGLRNRILVRLHVEKVETAALSKREMKRIAVDAKSDPDFDSEYAEAVLIYDELDAQDKLPKLKIMPSDIRQERYSGKTDRGI